MKRRPLHGVLLGWMVLVALYGCSNTGSGDAGAGGVAPVANLIMYSTGVFGDTEVPVEDQRGRYAQELKSAGYGTLIEATFHVYPEGKIVLNGEDTWLVDEKGRINQLMRYILKDIYADLKTKGIKVYASIGGGGGYCYWDQKESKWMKSPPQSNWDYSRIMEFYKSAGTDHQFFKNLVMLKTEFGIDGIDLNYEPTEYEGCDQYARWSSPYPYAGYDSDFAELLVEMIKYLRNNDMRVIATPWRGPITNEDFWVDVINRTLTESGPMLDWLQVQQYSGSDTLGYWQGVAEKAGVKDPIAFLAAGYSCSKDACNIPDLPSLTESIRNTPAGLNKVFLWQYKAMIGYGGQNNCTYTASEYAAAIFDGFSKKASGD